MPEKTKLEDYSNMNNTGFAFIDLNEEIGKEYIIGSHVGADSLDVDEDISIDEKLYNKFYDIFESDKILFLKINLRFLINDDENNFYQELINFKNAIVYKRDKEKRICVDLYFGSPYNSVENVINFANKSYIHISLTIEKNSLGNYLIHIWTRG